MTIKTKLLNPMKIRTEEYKGFAVDLKHGKKRENTGVPTEQTLEPEKYDLKKEDCLEPTLLRTEDYKGML